MRVLNAGINILLNKESINPSMIWDDYCIKRYLNKLYFLDASQLESNQNLEPENWKIKKPLRLDNDGGLLKVTLVRGRGLSLSKCDQNLTIRYRIGGESIKPVGHKITKKLKNLFQENHILPWVRDKIPLIYSGTELIGVADLWVHDDYIASQNEHGFLIDWQRKINIKHN
jgi:tRNA(Ile)-lysidine synthase